MSLKEQQEYLQDLTEDLEDYLYPFIQFAKEEGAKLDYKLESLPELEKFLLALKADFESEEGGELFEDCWLYLGETVRRALKGEWKISDDEIKKPEFYLLPVIANYNSNGDEYCPGNQLKEFQKVKEKGLLKRALGL